MALVQPPAAVVTSVPPPITGKAIREALGKGGCPLQILVPELIIQGGCTFIVAGPKVGKTTVALQLVMSLTTGTPVFGALPVEPCQVYYFAFETSFHRFVNKAEKMQKAVPFNPDLLIFDPYCNGKDATDPNIQTWLLSRIKASTDSRLKLVVIDPAYKMAPGGLGKDDVASRFCAFLGRVNQETGAAVLVLHHSHREKWDKGKIVVERNPSFGSQWLIAHPDLMVQLEKLPTGDGVKLRVTEDREEICRPEMVLNYDTNTGTVLLETSDSGLEQRLVSFFQTTPKGSLFTTKELAAKVSCSVPSLKRIIGSETLGRLSTLIQSPGRPTIWKVGGG